MKYSLICNLCLSALCALWSSSASSHEVEVCLQQVAQAAEQLRVCRIAQRTETQCDLLDQKLERYKQRCRDAEFTAEDIQRAQHYGEGNVSGNPDSSPYQRHVTRMQWKQRQTDPNWVRFSRVFPNRPEFRDTLLEHFGTRDCPSAYEGRKDRWLYIETLQLI